MIPQRKNKQEKKILQNSSSNFTQWNENDTDTFKRAQTKLNHYKTHKQKTEIHKKIEEKYKIQKNKQKIQKKGEREKERERERERAASFFFGLHFYYSFWRLEAVWRH